MRRMEKKYLLGLLLFLLIWVSCLISARAEEYPTKPIDFIITFGAGGNIDLSSRALADLAGKHLGQPFVPLNKAGAAGVIGVTSIKNAKPDGYTIGLLTTSAALVAPFSQVVPYDVLQDFTYIARYGDPLFFLAVRSDKPWKTWKEVIDFGRTHPGALKIGIAGSRLTNVNGIALSRIAAKEKIKFTFIPLKSGAEILTATLGGHVDIYASSLELTGKDYIAMGKLRVLASLSDRKMPGFENIPTTQEIHGVSIMNCFGIIGPKGLAPDIAKKLEEAFLKSMKDPSLEIFMDSMSTTIIPMTGQQFYEFIKKSYKEQKEIFEMLKAEEGKK